MIVLLIKDLHLFVFGKFSNLPIYKLLGGKRDKIKSSCFIHNPKYALSEAIIKPLEKDLIIFDNINLPLTIKPKLSTLINYYKNFYIKIPKINLNSKILSSNNNVNVILKIV